MCVSWTKKKQIEGFYIDYTYANTQSHNTHTLNIERKQIDTNMENRTKWIILYSKNRYWSAHFTSFRSISSQQLNCIKIFVQWFHFSEEKIQILTNNARRKSQNNLEQDFDIVS